jgi:tRNA threonylcarbamoyladenosine biosynthesis protein TsaB
MCLILNIDSSLEKASVTLAKDGIIVAELTNDIQKNHAAFIHTAAKKLLENNSFSTLDAVAVTIGPGSYTGLRVGLAAAKGLCYTLNKPLITIGTLEAMAKTAISHISEKKDIFLCPMIDARRMEVFTAIYNINLQEVKPAYAQVLSENSYEAFLTKKVCYFFGNGMPKWKDIQTNKNAYYIDIDIDNKEIANLSYSKFMNTNFANLVTSAPLYTKEFYSN